MLVWCLYKEVYLQNFECVFLITQLLRGVGRFGSLTGLTTPVGVEVTPTDRPKSVRNRCKIEFCVALFVLSICSFDISGGVGAFVTRLSQISSFFLLQNSAAIALMYKKQVFKPTCSISSKFILKLTFTFL